MGGVEFGFTSTSKHKSAAVDYSLGGGAPTVFEMQTGMVDRGASIGCLSQYPWEEEILFAPLLGMEVQRTKVDGVMLVVVLRLTVNLTANSLEEQLAKRKRLVQQMCDNIRVELKAELNALYPNDKAITELDDDSVVRLGEHLSKGVSIATPVFDGAKEADIVEMLERSRCLTPSPSSGLRKNHVFLPASTKHKL